MTELWLADDVRPMGQMLLHSAAKDPGKDALVFPDRRLSYQDLADGATQVADSLIAMGVEAGEHVGVLMTNHPDLVISVFGAALAGCVVVPINARYRTSELRFIVEDAVLSVLLTHDSADEHVDYAALIDDALEGLEHRPTLVMMGAKRPPGFVAREDFDALHADPALLRNRIEGVALRSTALILYTSGTTSQPRGAMLSHEAFVRGWLTTARTWRSTAEDRQWSALPLFHVTALGCVTWTLGCGGTFYSDYFFDAGRAVECLEQERITEFYPAYQPVMEAIIGHPRFASADISAIRVFCNVAPPEVLARFQRAIPHAVQLTVYGGTEGGVVTTVTLDDPLEVRLNTCGACQPGMELRIVDVDDGRVLGPGERGVIHFRGFCTLDGYWNDTIKTKESILPGGWVTMGDLGVCDEHGRVLFLGRVKETLKVGGENVAPQEIESQLALHPAVRLVQVVGIPDERLLEVPAAFVELLPGMQATEEELIEHCRGAIASFKLPRMIRLISGGEWPMSATKIQRFRLRDRLLEELGTRT